ncbi:MAG TPA: hypothetical protein VJ044_01625 [Candidatus Hodarchaeales archaeon]|nr:hypothetical protein [Candidatus Hodarchaeales archaeon]
MENRRYVRFENTYKDLWYVYDNLFDDTLSDSEAKYRRLLVVLCKKIVDDGFEPFVMDEESN